MPVRTLVVHSTRRYDEATNTTIRLPARDFWNIAGRVGRAGAETEGSVIFLSLNNIDWADFNYYVQNKRSVEPVTSALMRMLQGLIANRISSDDIARQLDPEMLALLVEEGEGVQTPAGLREIVGETLFQVQSDAEAIPTELMWSTLADTSTRVAVAVPDVGQRAAYATTGLSSVSCLAIRSHVVANQAEIGAIFTGDIPDAEVRRLMLEGVSQCSEVSPRDISASHTDLPEAWIEGRSMVSIAEEFDLDAVVLTRFIEDFFRYQLPWGVSGYLRIAQDVVGAEELPKHLQGIPICIRYGVPTATAAWVMSLGIPSRSLATTLAAAYEKSSQTPSVRRLRRWLSSLNVEALAEDYGVSAGSLDATSRVVLKANGNRLLKQFYAGAPLLPTELRLRFRRLPRSASAIARLTNDYTLSVVRDYDSPSRNAMVVKDGAVRVARLPRQFADALALIADCEGAIEAHVIAVEPTDDGVVVTLRLQKSATYEGDPQNVM